MNRNENTHICSCRRIDDVVFVLFFTNESRKEEKKGIYREKVTPSFNQQDYFPRLLKKSTSVCRQNNKESLSRTRVLLKLTLFLYLFLSSNNNFAKTYTSCLTKHILLHRHRVCNVNYW